MTNGVPTLSDSEFLAIRDLLQRRFGINLTEQKRSLVIGRLSGMLRKEGFASFEEFYRNLTSDVSGRSLSALVDRLSTNHTHFYRESEHYSYFAETVLPEFRSRSGSVHEMPRIWIAGCSSGEEAYNVAMYLLESLGSVSHPLEATILATDISSTALGKAQKGVYSAENIGKLPPNLSRKYFHKCPTGAFEVVNQLRSSIVFRRLNLIREVFPFKRRFHTIFCRNVMIYFDNTTRTQLVRQFSELIEPGGYLFIGHSETLGRETPSWRYVRPALYQRVSER